MKLHESLWKFKALILILNADVLKNLTCAVTFHDTSPVAAVMIFTLKGDLDQWSMNIWLFSNFIVSITIRIWKIFKKKITVYTIQLYTKLIIQLLFFCSVWRNFEPKEFLRIYDAKKCGNRFYNGRLTSMLIKCQCGLASETFRDHQYSHSNVVR